MIDRVTLYVREDLHGLRLEALCLSHESGDLFFDLIGRQARLHDHSELVYARMSLSRAERCVKHILSTVSRLRYVSGLHESDGWFTDERYVVSRDELA